MAQRLAQCFWVLVGGAILGAALFFLGVPARWAWIVAGAVSGILALVVLIAPVDHERWHSAWSSIADLASQLVWWR